MGRLMYGDGRTKRRVAIKREGEKEREKAGGERGLYHGQGYVCESGEGEGGGVFTALRG